MPTGRSAMRSMKSDSSRMPLPLTAVMISSAFMPALDAGPSFFTSLTITPWSTPSARKVSGLVSLWKAMPMEPRVTRPSRMMSL